MLKTAARLALLSALISALPASAQAPASGPAEALAWRGFQACLQVSRGAALDKAAAEAGFLKSGERWTAEIAERTVTIELVNAPVPAGSRGCAVVSRGPLADHAGFGKRIGAWAGKEGLTGPDAGVTNGGGQTLNYAAPDGARAVVLALFPDTGNPDQPARSILFVGWMVP